VVFFSTDTSNANRFLALHLGADAVFNKDMVMLELVEKIRKILYVKKIFDTIASDTLINHTLFHSGARYFQYRLIEELARSSRYKNKFALVIIQIDKIFSIAKQYSRQSADTVLKKAAKIFRFNIRAVDLLCKYGQDKFMLLLLDANLSTANVAVKRIYNVIQKSDFGSSEQPFLLKLSYGISICGEDGIKDLSSLFLNALTNLEKNK
ncbi:MAG: hypothetical protein DRP78_04030, partial [Candidatus Omnitrophota bacterium]